MLKSYKFEGSKNSGASKWFMQRISGIILVILLLGHYVLMHATPDNGHTYQAVLERLRQPVWKAIDLSFITFGLWHGLNGTWNVFRDFQMKPFWSITILTLIVISGLAFWFLGINTILKF
jgi:succinate dehydrogenase / fumarate reductase, membrane anchor subunit